MAIIAALIARVLRERTDAVDHRRGPGRGRCALREVPRLQLIARVANAHAVDDVLPPDRLGRRWRHVRVHADRRPGSLGGSGGWPSPTSGASTPWRLPMSAASPCSSGSSPRSPRLGSNDHFDTIFARNDEPRGVLLAASLMFMVGLFDDIREISAPAKVVGTDCRRRRA